MIVIRQKMIYNIPVLELFDDSIENKELPAVVFFHGWTNVKESVLVHGFELAKRGMRAILPEAYLHGERDKTGHATDNNIIFWEVVAHNIKELPVILNDYTEKGLIDKNRIGVAGLSMGGITTSAALTQFEWIKAAVVLMGSPSPILFSKWLLESNHYSEITAGDVLNNPDINMDKTIEKLKEISLDLYPERIDGKPVHFWHGRKDEAVPFELTDQFIKANTNDTYGKNITFTIGTEDTHKVPYDISVEMAKYFKKQL